jgi:hypothetical protein
MTLTLTGWAYAAPQWVEPDAVSLLQVDSFEFGDLFGWLVLPLGDVNSDGVPDFAAGAPFSSTGGASSGGRVSVRSGANGQELWFDFSGLQSGIMGYTLEACRDVDGDGALDFLAAAPFNGASGGIVRLYSGRTGAILHPFPSPAPNSNFGASISASGDFNGDGVNDIAIGAPADDTIAQNAGRVYVYSGVNFALITAINPPESGLGTFGDAIEFIGDISKPPDGRDELSAGIRLSGSTPPGKIYALEYNGASVAIRYTITNVSLSGALDSDRLSGGQDVDGDGVDDLLVGQLNLSTAQLHSGASGALLHTFTGDPSTQYGSGSLIPDITGDGRPDLIIGARSNDIAANNGGRVYLYSGSDYSLLRTMTGTLPSRGFGADADVFGDLNGDGALDLIVGASGSSMGGPGQVQIMRGNPPSASQCPADIAPAPSGNGSVDVDDLIAVILAWGPCPGMCPPRCPADIAPIGPPQGNCFVDVDDLIAVILHWGPCP